MPTREQTADPYDDASCRFYGAGSSYALLANDLSQLEDDTPSDASAIYENSARFNHGSPRTMLWMLAALASTTTGTLWRHGSGGNLEWLTFSPSGGTQRLLVYVNGAVVLTWTLPSTLGEVWIAWVSEPNPSTTGASDAIQSWLMLHSVTSGQSARVRFTHAAKNSEATTAYVGASSSGGVNACTEQIRTFGFWSRLWTLTELANTHWDTSTPPASTVAATERQELPIASGTIDVVDEPHGPAAQLAGAALSHSRWRTMGALYNERMRYVPTITTSTEDTGDDVSKIRPALGSAIYRMHLGWFRAYPVSPTANALFVRVHARVWSIVPGLRTGYWGLRLYAFSRRPVIGQSFIDEGELPEPLQWRYAEEEVADDNHLSTDQGDWRIDAVIPIVRGASGISRDRVYLALAYAVDPAETNTVPDADLRLEVRAIQAVQLFDGTVGQPPLGGPSGEAG